MDPDTSPIVPEFVPDDVAAPFLAEAGETVRRSAFGMAHPHHQRGDLSVIRDILVTASLALVLFTAAAGILFVLNASAPLGRIVAVVALFLAALWPAYLYATKRR